MLFVMTVKAFVVIHKTATSTVVNCRFCIWKWQEQRSIGPTAWIQMSHNQKHLIMDALFVTQELGMSWGTWVVLGPSMWLFCRDRKGTNVCEHSALRHVFWWSLFFTTFATTRPFHCLFCPEFKLNLNVSDTEKATLACSRHSSKEIKLSLMIHRHSSFVEGENEHVISTFF